MATKLPMGVHSLASRDSPVTTNLVSLIGIILAPAFAHSLFSTAVFTMSTVCCNGQALLRAYHLRAHSACPVQTCKFT